MLTIGTIPGIAPGSVPLLGPGIAPGSGPLLGPGSTRATVGDSATGTTPPPSVGGCSGGLFAPFTRCPPIRTCVQVCVMPPQWGVDSATPNSHSHEQNNLG